MNESKHLPLLEARHITKQFPGVLALDQVDLELHPGEVLAVIGENEAGKSTLMKILAGIYMPDAGEILIEGSQFTIDSVQKAMDLGITLIHQELNLCDNLDIGSNIFLGREPLKRGLIDKKEIQKQSETELGKVGLRVSPATLVRDLAAGQQQMVEIAKALSINARFLIMDEPTSCLTQHETSQLFKVIRDLRSKGVCIVYITHRLSEVKQIADRAAVLRDGKNSGLLQKSEITRESMVKLMVGRDLSQFYGEQTGTPGEIVLEAKELCTPDNPACPLNFSLKKGEIVGMAGLVGAGRTELMQVLFGVKKPLSGTLSIRGKEVVFDNPGSAISKGIALVPENRKSQGLILNMLVRANIALPGIYRQRAAGIFHNRTAENKTAEKMTDRLNIKISGHNQLAVNLSGGNQQKTVLGKWLALDPQILLLDEPTKGVDVGSKKEIYAIIKNLAEQGASILFVSSEMEEVLGIADRVIVMYEGGITGELKREEASEEAVMQLAIGHKGGYY